MNAMDNRPGVLGTSISQYLLLQAAAVVLFIVVASLMSAGYLGSILKNGLILASIVLLLLQLRELLKFEELPDLRKWQLIVVAVAMWAFVRLYQTGAIVLSGAVPPVPSIVDLLRLAGFLAMTAALVILPVSEGRRFGRVRDLLDVIIIVSGSLVVFFLLVMQPALQVGIDSPVIILWAGLPPAFDITLILLAVRLRLLAQTNPERDYLGLLALAFVFRLPSDLAVGYGLLRPEPLLGDLLALGWLLSPMALLISAKMRQRAYLSPGSAMKVESDWKRIASRVESYLPPFLVYLVAGYTLVSYWLLGDLNYVGLASTAVLGILLVARQGVIAGQSEMRQQAALVSAAADLAFICTDEGDILLANPAMRAATGVNPEDEEGPSLANIISGAEVDEILQQGEEGGWTGEVRLVDSNGDPFPVALSVRPVPDERSHQIRLAATAHDLTALKEREDELRQALAEVAEARQQLVLLNQSLEQKVEQRTEELAETIAHLEQLNEELKELDRLKSEFVTLVSHELRGPLTNIRSGVELALTRAEGLPTSAEETLELVSAETERLVSFVEIILDLSALEAGRFPLEIKAIPLSVLSRAVADRFPPDKSDRIQVEFDEEVPPVWADEQALTSVLFHLMDNGLKYAPTGPIRLTARQTDEAVEVSVLDQGPGIPAEAREAVFDRFHRLDTRDSREIYGHGLGLYLSRRLLRAMGGEIQVGDHPGGAKLTFRLQLAEVAQPETPQG